jgi:hypothetical protein
MFKKNAWIAVPLIALVIMFASCIDAAEDEGGEVVELFRLSKVIADVPDGTIEDFDSVFAETPIMKCGGLRFSIITEKGVKKLKLDGMTQTWGEGIDLMNTPGTGDNKNSGLNFRKGDTIQIVGSADPVGIYLNAKGGAHADTDNWQSDSVPFDHTTTLTAENVGAIRTGNPQVIRIHYHSTKGNRQGTIIFEEIVVMGNRSNAEDVQLDDFEISGTVQQKSWNEGIVATPKKGKTNGKITYYYRTQADEGTNTPAGVWKTDLADFQASGTYDVKFDVAAAKGFNAASFDGITMQVIDVMPVAKSYDFDMTGANAKYEGTGGTFINGSAGKKWCFLYNTVVPADVVTAMPVAVRDFTPGATPRLVIYLSGIEPNWQAFSTVTITYDLLQVSGVHATVPPDTNVIARKNNGTSGVYGHGGDASPGYPDLKVGLDQTITFDVKDNSGSGINGFNFTKNHGNTGVLISVTKIEFKY